MENTCKEAAQADQLLDRLRMVRTSLSQISRKVDLITENNRPPCPECMGKIDKQKMAFEIEAKILLNDIEPELSYIQDQLTRFIG